MASCKNCLSVDVCKNRDVFGDMPTCEHFKDRTRFVELPCKVGDTVYLILGVQNRILEFTVQEIRLTSRFLQLVFAEGSTYSIWGYRFDLHFGKTVFLTREEAEKALEEQDSNVNK